MFTSQLHLNTTAKICNCISIELDLDQWISPVYSIVLQQKIIREDKLQTQFESVALLMS